MIKGKLAPLALLAVAREVQSSSGDDRPLVVAGAKELVPLLAKELRAGGEAGAVRENGTAEGAAVLIWVGDPDESALRAASRAGVEIVGVTEASGSLPYVLDTDLVRVRPGQGFPIEEIAHAVARKLGAQGTRPAARLPVLREAVVDELIRSAARKNGLIGAAVFIPGVDLPVLTLNQVRLVLRIALAYGHEIDPARGVEVLGVVGAAFGFRAIARELLDLIPVAGWAAKGAVAFAGTRAVGEAARKRFAAVAA